MRLSLPRKKRLSLTAFGRDAVRPSYNPSDDFLELAIHDCKSIRSVGATASGGTGRLASRGAAGLGGAAGANPIAQAGAANGLARRFASRFAGGLLTSRFASGLLAGRGASRGAASLRGAAGANSVAQTGTANGLARRFASRFAGGLLTSRRAGRRTSMMLVEQTGIGGLPARQGNHGRNGQHTQQSGTPHGTHLLELMDVGDRQTLPKERILHNTC